VRQKLSISRLLADQDQKFFTFRHLFQRAKKPSHATVPLISLSRWKEDDRKSTGIDVTFDFSAPDHHPSMLANIGSIVTLQTVKRDDKAVHVVGFGYSADAGWGGPV